MTNSPSYIEHHHLILAELADNAVKLLAMDTFVEEQHNRICDRLTALCKTTSEPGFYESGQDTLCKIVAAWPQLTPLIPRDLFWFFGGDCLQYMPDHEIAKYQLIDEARYDAESQGTAFDFNAIKGQIFGLH